MLEGREGIEPSYPGFRSLRSTIELTTRFRVYSTEPTFDCQQLFRHFFEKKHIANIAIYAAKVTNPVIVKLST